MAADRSPVSLSINIKATPQEVWEVITDHENYGDWNEWVVRIEGEAKVGSKVRAYAESGTSLKLRITEMTPPFKICWVDITWFTYLGAGGWRCRSIKPHADGKGVLFLNHFEYTGPFAGVLDYLSRETLIEGMSLENQNLKDYLEVN